MNHVIIALLVTLAIPTFPVGGQDRIVSDDIALNQSPKNKGATPTNRKGTRAVDRKISVDIENMSLKDAIRIIQNISKVDISYWGDDIPNKVKVSLKKSHITVRDAVETIIRGVDLTVQVISDDMIAIIKNQHQQQGGRDSSVKAGNISGTVTESESNAPVPGVRISMHGVSDIFMTDSSGRFSLKQVPVGTYEILFQKVGYSAVRKTVAVNAGQEVGVSVSISRHVSTLTEVITTATGMQQKLEVGNAITKIDVPALMERTPISSITEILETRVPGLTVVNTSGAPGAPARLRLRGAGSISRSNDPIVIVDGIRVFSGDPNVGGSPQRLPTGRGGGFSPPPPSMIDQIDPFSIETIEVFKGPSAAAMYGSEAANGVIIITTKRGRVGKTMLNASVEKGISYMPGEYPVGVFQYGRSLSTNQILGSLCEITDLTCKVDSVVRFQALNEDRYTLFDRGNQERVTGTLSGGVSMFTYSLTGGVSNDQGIVKMPDYEFDRISRKPDAVVPNWMKRPDFYKTWSGSGAVSAKVSETTQINVNTSLVNSRQRRGTHESTILTLIRLMGIDTLSTGYTPLLGTGVQVGYNNRLTTNISSSLDWRALPWLPIHLTAGINSGADENETILQNGAGDNTSGYYAISRGHSTFKTASGRTSIRIPYGRTAVRTSFGINLNNQNTGRSTSSVTGVAVGIVRPTSVGAATQSVYSTTIAGWYMEPQVSVNERLFITPGFRIDGGNATGSRAKFSGFPKINISWLMSNEPFFSNMDLINSARLRLSFGNAGVQPGPHQTLRLYQSGSMLINNAYEDVVSFSSLGNSRLQPEKSSEIEGGLDLEFMNGKFRFEYTQYKKVRHNAIITIPVAPSVSAGTTNMAMNIGMVRNTGVEIGAHVKPLEFNSFYWQLSGSLSKNDNTVLDLGQGEGSIAVSDLTTRIVKGYPLFSRWAVPILSYHDINGNGVIDKNEVKLGDTAVYMGRQDPDYQVSINSHMSLFSSLNVSLNVSYQHGLTQYNSGMATGMFLNEVYNPNASLFRQAANQVRGQTQYGYIQTVNILRLNSMSLSYAVPRHLTDRIGSDGVSISLMGKNLGMRTNYSGKDPNVNQHSTGDIVTDNGANIPTPRTWLLRVSLSR